MDERRERIQAEMLDAWMRSAWERGVTERLNVASRPWCHRGERLSLIDERRESRFALVQAAPLPSAPVARSKGTPGHCQDPFIPFG
ncbi:hypothetical protein [Ktedonobacter sp. SOSP1-85]|uniref:hypothetical protein n=1 Tax=Ktedonobacter sp. SOSP1-85 TaxID=2778367 RepID=UPI0019168BE0|nr:hypothetical protein [Ktedonobacter sp. SOSP1-85]